MEEELLVDSIAIDYESEYKKLLKRCDELEYINNNLKTALRFITMGLCR